MALSEQARIRLSAEVFYWFLMIVFIAIWIPYRTFIPMTLQVRHTYELPAAACVNRLTSDRWTWEFLREGLFVLFILIPFSGMFMIWTKSRTGIWTHAIVLIILLLWAFVMVGYDAEDIRNANLPPSHGAWNPSNLANDKQWCLVYGGQPGTELVCANSGPCTGSAVSHEDLQVNGPFAFRVSFNVFMILFCVVDMIFTFWTWWPALTNWMNPTEQEKEENVQQKITTSTTPGGFTKYTLLKDRK